MTLKSERSILISGLTDKSPIFSWLGALNDPIRARLLRLIEQHELSVGEIAQVLQLPQSTASRHIKILSDQDWLSSRRAGTSRLYRLDHSAFPESQRRLWAILRDSLKPEGKVQSDDARLQRVLLERQSKGQAFFASAAGRWDKLRGDLFGTEFELHLLASLLPKNATVVDLGCGTGRLTELLVPFAQRVVAVDGSEAMIEAARTRLRETHGPSVDEGKIEFCLAQLQNLPLDSAQADVALMVLVAHYVSDPAAAFVEAARLLKPGGQLLILDMQPHDQDEFRGQMGHLWQGFDATQLMGWLTAVGFTDVRYTPVPPDPSSKGPALFVSSAHTTS